MAILEDRGLFWWNDEPIPERHFAPDSAVGGVLRIEDDGRTTLELDNFLPNEKGPLSALFSNFNDKEVPDKRIQGITKGENKRVLLSGLYRHGGRFSSGGMSFERYLATNCLVGDGPFLPGSAPLEFDNLHIDLDGYEEWLRLDSIGVTRTEKTFSATYESADDIIYVIPEGKIHIHSDMLAPYFTHHKIRDVSLKETWTLIFEFSRQIAIEELTEQFGVMQDLFILLTNSDYNFGWPSISRSDDKKKYRLYFLRNKASASPPEVLECWTTFPQLREGFGHIISNWKNKRERFGPGFYLYLGTRRGMKMYAEHRFVNLIWGIEAYHRTKHPKEVVRKLTEKIKRIICAIAVAKDKKWLARRLKYADEPSLEDRIVATFEGSPFKLEAEGLRKFSASCAKMRNDISHFGGERESGDYGKFLHELDQRSDALACLYHGLLLYEVGVSEEIIDAWIHKGVHAYQIKKNFVEVGLLDPKSLKDG